MFQDISLLAAVFNVEKNNGCFRHLHVLLFVSRYLLVGVVWSSKSKGAFFVLIFCFKISFWAIYQTLPLVPFFLKMAIFVNLEVPFFI